MQYRRPDVAGGTYFFTVNLAERSRTLLLDHVDVLRTVIQEVKRRHPFQNKDWGVETLDEGGKFGER